jgi:hypothetical protein
MIKKVCACGKKLVGMYTDLGVCMKRISATKKTAGVCAVCERGLRGENKEHDLRAHCFFAGGLTGENKEHGLRAHCFFAQRPQREKKLLACFNYILLRLLMIMAPFVLSIGMELGKFLGTVLYYPVIMMWVAGVVCPPRFVKIEP